MRVSDSAKKFLVRWRLICRTCTFHFLILVWALLVPCLSTGYAAEVVLAWEANADPGLKGFRVYYGEVGRAVAPYSAFVNVADPSARSCTITALEAGKKYYFSATAYDVNGNESEYSAEISYSVPAPPSQNSLPVAVDDGVTTQEDRSITVDVLSNDRDPDGDALSVTRVGPSANGSVALLADGRVSYSPKANFNGPDSFSYTVSDGKGGTATGNVTVSVDAVNDAPVASDGTLELMQNTAATGNLRAGDPDGDALTYTILSQGTKGRVELSNPRTGAYTYTPYAASSGSDSFTFKASDGSIDSNTARVNVTITPEVNLYIEAESGSLVRPMVTARDRNASGGRYVYVPNGRGTVTDPLSKGGYAEYVFSIPVAGEYVISGCTMADSPSDDSFFVSVDSGQFITWNLPLGAKGTWIWSQLRDGFSAEPMKFYLGAGSHTLIFKQREDGAKLDRIRITSSSSCTVSANYAAAEAGMLDGWDVFDDDPYGAEIINIYDEEREALVMELNGAGIENGYRLQGANFQSWRDQKSSLMEWSMKYSGFFEVYVDVNTTAGRRYLRYRPSSSRDELGRGTYAGFTLGSGFQSGDWYTFVRDLQADLARAQPRVEILEVKAFMVRGDCSVDGVRLRRAME